MLSQRLDTKTADQEGSIQIIAAAADYYDKVADSSFEVEFTAMRNLWQAIVHIEYSERGEYVSDIANSPSFFRIMCSSRVEDYMVFVTKDFSPS